MMNLIMRIISLLYVWKTQSEPKDTAPNLST